MVRRRDSDVAAVVNKSITQTLTRSIYTSLTTFIMVAVLYVMGVSSIKEFALPLMVGVVCGSSLICKMSITGALWVCNCNASRSNFKDHRTAKVIFYGEAVLFLKVNICKVNKMMLEIPVESVVFTLQIFIWIKQERRKLWNAGYF